MRIYSNPNEMYAQVLRDVVKFGRELKSNTVQNLRDVGDEFIMKELQLYSFCVSNYGEGGVKDLLAFTKDPEWVIREFTERVSTHPANPGQAWKLREEYWATFLNDEGKFCYTYGQRMRQGISKAIGLLSQNPGTRQGIISLWDSTDTGNTGGIKRVPCSMYYNIQIRDGKLDIIYHMRSSDIFEHFRNDFTLACLLGQFIAANVSERTGETIKTGNAFMCIDSLHAYKKDWETLSIF